MNEHGNEIESHNLAKCIFIYVCYVLKIVCLSGYANIQRWWILQFSQFFDFSFLILRIYFSGWCVPAALALKSESQLQRNWKLLLYSYIYLFASCVCYAFNSLDTAAAAVSLPTAPFTHIYSFLNAHNQCQQHSPFSAWLWFICGFSCTNGIKSLTFTVSVL